MENIEIYRDENTIVEIDGLFDAFLKTVIIKTVKLRKEQYKILLEDTLDKLREKGWDFRSFISLKASDMAIALFLLIPLIFANFSGLYSITVKVSFLNSSISSVFSNRFLLS